MDASLVESIASWLSPAVVSLPIVGALIGWITNYIAIKLLFHPRLPWRFCGLSIQGLFPRRQKAFAEKLADVVARELIVPGDVAAAVQRAAQNPTVVSRAETLVHQALEEELRGALPALAMFFSGNISTVIRERISRRMPSLIEALGNEVGGVIGTQFDVRDIVYRKVSEFSSDQLEVLLLEIMRKEFKFIELSGAVLGFLIGGIQAAFLSFGR